jgi:hypothetical protein
MDNRYAKNVVCPFCKYEDNEWWDWIENHEEIEDCECPECGKLFTVEIMRDIKFTTYCQEEKHKYKFKHYLYAQKEDNKIPSEVWVCENCGDMDFKDIPEFKSKEQSNE